MLSPCFKRSPQASACLSPTGGVQSTRATGDGLRRRRARAGGTTGAEGAGTFWMAVAGIMSENAWQWKRMG